MVKKTVTEKKKQANKLNSSKSTGPRTDQGKGVSRFNATTSGLFAKQLVNPRCDGEGAEKHLAELLSNLQLQFQPKNVMENWLVERMTEFMWRLRRVALAERGSSFLSVWGGPLPTSENSPLRQLTICLAEEQRVLATLDAASNEIRDTGTLTKESRAAVLTLIDKPEESKNSESKESNESTSLIDKAFTQRLDEKRFALRSSLASLHTKMKEVAEHQDFKCSLPPTEDMDKILSYEKRMHKQLDWAWLKLREAQGSRSRKR